MAKGSWIACSKRLAKQWEQYREHWIESLHSHAEETICNSDSETSQKFILELERTQKRAAKMTGKTGGLSI